MRLLRRQPGLPFLMALGVLLILSASFLAVQLWSEKVYRGAAQALEAPVMPPAMPTARKVKSGAALDKKIEKAKTVAAVEVVNAPEVQSTEEVAPPAPAATPEKSRPVALQPAKIPEMIEAPAMPPAAGTKPARGAAKPVVKESAVKPAAEPVAENDSEVSEPVLASDEPEESVQSVAAKPVVKAAEPVVKAEPIVAAPVKPVETAAAPSLEEPRKPVAKKRRAVRVVDESEIPQEWNWFDTPLKIEISEGHVEIVPSEKVSVINLLPETPKIDDSVILNPSMSASEDNIRVDLASEKPFVAALARMGRLRSSRSALIAENPELEKAVAARRSESIAKLQEAVALLCNKLEATDARHSASNLEPVNDSPVVKEDASAIAVETAPAVESDETVKSLQAGAEEGSAAYEHRFVPYYSGSGSALSGRINDLVVKGVGSRRR